MLNRKYIGLKWKFTLVIVSVLIVLQILLTYLIYTDTTRNFNLHREEAQHHYNHIAKALLNKSALNLEQ